MIVKVAQHPGWAKLWDHTLDLGGKAVLGLQIISRAMSHHGRGKHPCHLCEDHTLKEDSVLEHILVSHHQELHLLEPSLNSLDLLSMLSSFKLEILPKFKNIF